ncbi:MULTISPECIES: DUF1843 domain-containing protein [unclassified Undibacterium]|uniref:DUF1843 domain-containing protein n=1 Tax=Undibacterium TaxID=401469 RepID=UPI001331E821|nr:DUF1843 domain-containing protein [Undibacterium sp. KW1]BBB62970.1 hypothetical protein UNDKW_4697 [Undibacterium sp. KW1]
MVSPTHAAPLAALYAVPMHEAIASGDVKKMSTVRDQALDYLAAASEIERLLPSLETAMKAKGLPPQALYGVAIQDAVTRGDQAEISRLKAQVAYYNRLF